MKDKLDIKYTLEDSNGNKYTILDTQRVDLQEELNKEIEKQAKEINRLHSIIKEVRNQLYYLETYSSKEDVFEDMKRRLDRIDKIIGSDKE